MPKYFRNRSLLLVVAAMDDVDAGLLTAEAALRRLRIDLLDERERRVYQYACYRTGTTVPDVGDHLQVSDAEARHILNYLVSVGLLETQGGAGHTKPYVYRAKGASDGH